MGKAQLDGTRAEDRVTELFARTQCAAGLQVVEDDISVDAWLASLPVASRLVLERARRPVAQWPDAPRIGFAVARPRD